MDQKNQFTTFSGNVVIKQNTLNIRAASVNVVLIAVREQSRKQIRVQEALQLAIQVGMPSWVEVSVDKAEGVFKKVPDRDEFGADINESLIVELYSR